MNSITDLRVYRALKQVERQNQQLNKRNQAIAEAIWNRLQMEQWDWIRERLEEE